MKNIYISLILFGIFLGIIIYTYFNQLNKKTNQKNLETKNDNHSQKNDKEINKSILKFINLSKSCEKINLLEEIYKVLEIKPNQTIQKSESVFNKKYDFITFTTKEDLLNKTHTLLEKIKFLTEEHYMNCILVIVDLDDEKDDKDNKLNILNNLSLFVHKINLNQIKDYYDSCRFILLDNLNFNKNNNNKLIHNLVLIGCLKLQLPLLCNSKSNKNYEKNKNTQNLTFFNDTQSFKSILDKFLMSIK